MDHDFNQPEQKPFRRHQRANMPLPEAILWSRLRGRQLQGLKFRRQHGIGRHIVDFYCAELKLAIELDGESHFESEDAERRDAGRQAFIESYGVTVVRFTNQQIGTELEAVLLEIERLAERMRRSPDQHDCDA